MEVVLEDDVPDFQLGDFSVPAVNFPGCSLTWKVFGGSPPTWKQWKVEVHSSKYSNVIISWVVTGIVYGVNVSNIFLYMYVFFVSFCYFPLIEQLKLEKITTT